MEPEAASHSPFGVFRLFRVSGFGGKSGEPIQIIADVIAVDQYWPKAKPVFGAGRQVPRGRLPPGDAGGVSFDQSCGSRS